MIDVTFHTAESVPDELLKFAVIAAEYEGKWVFCRHRLRSTWEIPGGHREPGEDIAETARRELQEETGAVEAELRPLSVYGVTADGTTSYGMLFHAVARKLDPLSEAFEIGELLFSETLPAELTYPAIQPHLYRYVMENK